MEKWEYKSLLCEGAAMETTLTALGEHGWEAVGFAPVAYQNSSNGVVLQKSATQYRVLLKRRKP
jgi:hypothetical protein